MDVIWKKNAAIALQAASDFNSRNSHILSALSTHPDVMNCGYKFDFGVIDTESRPAPAIKVTSK